MHAAPLESLRPRTKKRVLDLVASAGIDTSPWSFGEGGKPFKTPASNPKFCYEWAFGNDGEPSMLCVWHRALACDVDLVVYCGNMLAFGHALEAAAADSTQPSKVRTRAKGQARRALSFDRHVRRAFDLHSPIRVALLAGDEDLEVAPGYESSLVKQRVLDPEPWYVHQYDRAGGEFRLVRALPMEQRPTFVDQFAAPENAAKLEVTSTQYARSPAVRVAALERAQGKCELCDQPGFVRHDGSIYLETHHVVPLGEGGPDVAWNVTAVCPTDHRRAHVAADRDAIRKSLATRLANTYSNARGYFEQHVGIPPVDDTSQDG